MKNSLIIGVFVVYLIILCMGTIAVAEAVPEPTEPLVAEIEDWFSTQTDRLRSWFVGFLAPGAIVSTGEEAFPGDEFVWGYLLENTGSVTYPYTTTYTRGWLYKGEVVYTPDGSVEKELVTPITIYIDGVGLWQPGTGIGGAIRYNVVETSPSGQYVALATMIVQEATYNKVTKSWEYSGPRVVAKEAATFTVVNIDEPVEPEVNWWQFFADLFNNIRNWLCTLFGIFCA